ncbi:MAG: hypothetical protein RL060_1291 [Bacteroidota bacterium]|jgi:antitoxin component YwqK of YwqJK toxin-antitoxin module
MKTLLTILLYVGLYNSSLGCCVGDDRTLTEMLFQGQSGTIFTCKVLTFSTLKDTNNNILTSSDGSIDGKATAEIVTVYFGKVDTNIVTLRAGSYLTIGKTYLIYTEGSGQVFGFGGHCDRWSKEVTANIATAIELQTLKQFSDIFRNKSSGQFTFTNTKNIVIAQGQFKKGIAIKNWKHFYDNGVIKATFDLTKNVTSQYYDNGFIKTSITVHGKTVYFEQFSEKVSGQLSFTDQETRNDTSLMMTVTVYNNNGKIKNKSSQLSINSKESGTYSTGKTGDYKEFHENGNLQLQGQYLSNKRVGLWKWYHENGDFNTAFDYKDGSEGQ